MLVEASGGEPQLLATGQFADPGRFSPDGTPVLTSAGGGDRDPGPGRQGRGDDPDAYLFGAVWSPSGERIAYSRAVGGPYADVLTSLPDGTDRQQVTRTEANEIAVDWGVGEP